MSAGTIIDMIALGKMEDSDLLKELEHPRKDAPFYWTRLVELELEKRTTPRKIK